MNCDEVGAVLGVTSSFVTCRIGGCLLAAVKERKGDRRAGGERSGADGKAEPQRGGAVEKDNGVAAAVEGDGAVSLSARGNGDRILAAGQM